MSISPPVLTIPQHLEALRRRLLIAVAALVITTTISFIFAEKIIALLAVPIGGTQNLQANQVTENVSVFMRISLISGLILASPVILYQIMAFILPGLEKRSERNFVLIGIPIATLLFLAGALFTYFIMLPAALFFLTDFLDIPNIPRPSNYFEFVTSLIFWMGVGFETPILVFMLARLHVVTPRALVKNWRIALIIIAILAGIITPTVDPANMALLMAPLFVLYWISVLLAFLAVREK